LIHARQNDFRAAIDRYTESLRLERDPETLTRRGWAYLELGGAALALADFDEAVRLRPGSAEPLLGRADVRVKQGKVREALADAGKGWRHAPDTPRIAYLAARVYAQAAPALQSPPAGTRPSPGDGAACVRRAGELLRLALRREKADGRADFWRNYVRRDRAFSAPCLAPAVRAVEEEFFSHGR
jgi:tetratricopeptide (TPR) repeat protein